MLNTGKSKSWAPELGFTSVRNLGKKGRSVAEALKEQKPTPHSPPSPALVGLTLSSVLRTLSPSKTTAAQRRDPTMQAPPPVANSGEDVITRTVDVEPEAFSEPTVSLEEAYEVEMTLQEIERGDYQRVNLACIRPLPKNLTLKVPQIALQFPDELLHDSVAVFRALRNRLSLEKELYLLADTTYGR